MKNLLFIILSFLALAGVVYSWLNLSGNLALITCFIGGFLFGIFLMNLFLNIKNAKIDTYKRELEKESILSSESNSKVKVLEAKIEVLEKALENALKKN